MFRTVAVLSALVSPALAQPYVHSVPITANDTPQAIIGKAANVVPSPRQLAFMDLGFTAFIHFGINTYTGVEWGSGKEKAEIFNPGDTFDPDQWCRAAKDAGMKMMVITVKHHDGFCLWQTRYNDSFSVRSIPWKNGKGDVLKPLAAACKKHGLKLGVYLSPADLYQIENPKGLYGNGSKYQPTVIPTDIASFSTEPTKVRADKPKDAPVFNVEADDYNRYFMNQLYELLTEYGPVHEVWFDGAHPKTKGGQTYIKNEWFKLIRTLAPEAVIFGGPDVRWCGNESGKTRATEWNVLPVANELAAGEDRRNDDLGSEKQLLAKAHESGTGQRETKFLMYLVPETNTSIRTGWFWRNEHEQGVRTADDVFDIYERATGGNSVFLLNLPPDKRGLIADREVAVLKETGRRIRETYEDFSLMKGIAADEKTLVDNSRKTSWKLSGKTGETTFQFPEARRVNRFVVQEDTAQVGERVSSHALDAWIDGAWQEVATATNIGYKRILRFVPVKTDRFRLRILDSRLPAAINAVAFHYYEQPLPSLVAKQDTAGNVTIEPVKAPGFSWKPHGQKDPSATFPIHYTIDGSMPGPKSPLMEKPIAMPEGGMIKAVAIAGGKAGPILETRVGIAHTGWKIHSVSSEHAGHEAAKAIDGDPATQWHTNWEKSPPHPHTIVIDTGKEQSLSGFTYLPRQDKAVPDGMIETGEVSASTDGTTWTTPEPFKFGNLVNDPSQRTFLLGKPAEARYFRIVSKTGAAGKPYAGAAEIGLLSK
ncbi:MAG: alpha-L-fucosidase [Verrucomicrobiota bacterium]